MIGTNPTGRGGVASVVTVLKEVGFFEQHNIRYVASHAEGSKLTKLFIYWQAILALLLFCRSNRGGIVHVHAASRASFYRKSLLLALARVLGCKTIFHLHGAEFQQFAVHESGRHMQWWIRRTLRKSTRVIALSKSWADFLADYSPGSQIEVVPNSVKMPDPVLCFQPESGRIVFLGRAEKRKGIFELLKAVALLKSSIPEIKLAVGGDGDLQVVQAAIQELGISECVEILGWIGPIQKHQELARASVFALPSYDEGLPMAMLEAMAAAKAIVVTPVGGIPETVEDGKNGLLVSPGDENGLAGALGRVLNDADLRRLLGINARNTIRDRYSTDVVISKLSALYGEFDGKKQT